jgi:spermidine/putrescine-binding protein
MKSKKTLVGALSVICVVLLIVTVSAVAGKKQEGEGGLRGSIRMLCWEGYDFPQSFAKFEERTGVSGDPTYISSNDEIFSKLKAGGEYDIITPNQANVEQLVLNDLLQEVDPSRIPNYEKIHPYILKAYEPFNYGGKIWGVPCAFGKDDFIYAADRAEMIESWHDVLKPEWEGRYIMLDNALGLITMAARAVGVEGDPSLLNEEQFEDVRQFLLEVKSGARAIVSSFGEAKSALISGEADGWLGGNIMIAGEAQKEGYQIWGDIPKEGSLIFLDAYCIPKSAPNLEGAYALINEMLSVDTQLELASMYMGCVTTDAPKQLDDELYSYFPYDNLEKFFTQSVLNGPIPLEAGQYATMEDWTVLWEEVKAAR